ncbi:MAG: hypothetical protein K940chlam7_00503 [Chlamydiae bacterium]|nr:hypothetical protein [Chlamydiota bacterium]
MLLYPSYSEMEERQSRVWEYLCSNPKMYQQILHNQFVDEAFAFMSHLLLKHPQQAVSLLPHFRIILPEDIDAKDVASLLIKIFLHAIDLNKSDTRVDLERRRLSGSNVVEYQKIIPENPTKKLLFHILKDKQLEKTFAAPFWDAVLENKTMLLYDKEQEFSNRRFYLFLVDKLVNYLTNNKREKEMGECAEFLQSAEQLEGLIYFCNGYKVLKMGHELEFLLSTLKLNGVVGAPATEHTIDDSHKVSSFEKLQLWDRVIARSKKLKNVWAHGRVVVKEQEKGRTRVRVYFPFTMGMSELIIDSLDDIRFVREESSPKFVATKTLGSKEEETSAKMEDASPLEREE